MSKAIHLHIQHLQEKWEQIKPIYIPTRKDQWIRKNIVWIGKQKNLVIAPADKNLGTVIIDKQRYVQLMQWALAEPAYAICHDEFPIDLIIHRILMLVKEAVDDEAISKATSKFIKNDLKYKKPVTPYGIIKIHKNPIELRLIAPATGYVTGALGKVVGEMLFQVAKTIPDIIHNTLDITYMLEQNIWENGFFYTYDVVALYPNTDMSRLGMLTRLLIKHIPAKELHFLFKALHILRDHQFILFEGNLYKQEKGVTTGAAFAPSYANIWMHILQDKLLVKMRHYQTLHKRYIDDGLGFWTGPLNLFHKYQYLMNNLHPDIKFKFEVAKEFTVFLDLEIAKPIQGKVTLKTHRKSLNNYEYLTPHTCHPRATLKGFVKGELIRLLRTNSYEKDFLYHKQFLINCLLKRGYDIRWIHQISDQMNFSLKSHYEKPLAKNKEWAKEKTLLKINYHPSIQRPLKQVINEATPIYALQRTLRNTLTERAEYEKKLIERPKAVLFTKNRNLASLLRYRSENL